MAKQKGLLDKAIDAVTSRDERQAAEEATKAAETARAQAEREAQQRKAAEEKARTAEERARAAEKAAAEAKAQVARAEREKIDDVRRAAAQQMKEQKTQRVYVVKSGDSLSKIAKELLGDGNRWREIFEANKDQIKDPNLIYPGQELRIPQS